MKSAPVYIALFARECARVSFFSWHFAFDTNTGQSKPPIKHHLHQNHIQLREAGMCVISMFWEIPNVLKKHEDDLYKYAGQENMCPEIPNAECLETILEK